MSCYLTIMPPSKVCPVPQCEPLRLKVCKCCEHVFRAKRKAENNLPDKVMKRMRVLQSVSNLLLRLKISYKRAVKERKKLASKLCTDEKSMRASETSKQTVHRREKGRNHMQLHTVIPIYLHSPASFLYYTAITLDC